MHGSVGAATAHVAAAGAQGTVVSFPIMAAAAPAMCFLDWQGNSRPCSQVSSSSVRAP